MTIARRAVELVRLRRHQRDARVPRAVVAAPRATRAMALIVQKYGGTSVGSAERISNVARRVAQFHREGHQLVVVVSAMAGETNRLLGAREGAVGRSPIRASSTSSRRPASRSRSACSRSRCRRWASRRAATPAAQVRILTDSAFTKARILDIDEAKMRARSRRRHDRRSSPDSRAWTRTATSRRSAAAARTRRAWRSPRRSRPTSARSTPTSTASTRPTRASCPRRGGSTRITFEEMLELASLGLEGAADPLGRVRRQVQGQAARAVVVRGSRGDVARARSSRSRKTRTWNRRSFPASRSTATRPRSR